MRFFLHIRKFCCTFAAQSRLEKCEDCIKSRLEKCNEYAKSHLEKCINKFNYQIINHLCTDARLSLLYPFCITLIQNNVLT